MVKSSKLKSFTLIELLISVGVLGLALAVTGGVLLAVVKSYQKQKVIAEVERNGEFAMSYLEEVGIKALSVACLGLLETSAVCNNTLASQLVLGQETSLLYVGLKKGPDLSCSGGTKNNYYVYSTGDQDTINDSKKLTNDSINGVDVSNLTFNVVSGSPVRITVTMDVKSSNCNSWSIKKRFQSFITVRGTYQ